jgi:hypothetical protein
MATVCPKDGKACIDDMCRGSGVCGITGAEMWDRCSSCHGVYSYELGVECACEPSDDYDDEPEHVCFEDTCVCTDGMCGDSEAED